MSPNYRLSSAIESVLFLSDEALSLARLCDITGEAQPDVQAALSELAADLERSGRGIQLREVSGGFRLYTHPGYARIVERYLLAIDKRRLTQAALETLAVIAYKQPVPRSEISRIRGVNAEAATNSLVEKGFVAEVGRDPGPGQAILYGTTGYFLEQLGLVDISELPPIDSYAPDDDTKEQIALSFKGAFE